MTTYIPVALPLWVPMTSVPPPQIAVFELFHRATLDMARERTIVALDLNAGEQ